MDGRARLIASLMSATFVGRHVELALLEAVCLKANSDDRPAAAFITGLPGSGKTRLVAELRSRQRANYRLSITGYPRPPRCQWLRRRICRELGKV